MREVRDTFLHYLADNMEDVEVHPMRRDPEDQSAAVLKMNAVNVGFEDLNLNTDVSEQYVVIDVVFDYEMTAVDVVTKLWSLLRVSMTRIVNYANPSEQGNGNICWERSDVRFRRVDSDLYAHFSCVMPLKFHSG